MNATALSVTLGREHNHFLSFFKENPSETRGIACTLRKKLPLMHDSDFEDADPAAATLAAVNARFNAELARQIMGTLPPGHIYQLGHPGRILLSADIPDLPIELSAARLAQKASAGYVSAHAFQLSDVMNLPHAMQHPIAVFDSKTKVGSKVVLVELTDRGGNNFVVAMNTNVPMRQYQKDTIQINSIRSVYPKDNVRDIVNWINRGDLLRYVDKKKIEDWITQQRSNSADVEIQNLDIATKILKAGHNGNSET